MDGETLISWTPANWFTVILMVALFWAIMGFIAQLVKARKAQS